MEQPDIPFESAEPSRAPDPYLEGFAEGRRSMARSIALKLSGAMPDEEIASLVGLAPDELAALVAPPTPHPEETAAERPAIAPAAVPGLSIVEPAFVRTVRAARNLTQPELARIVGVHPDTVSEWETAPGPVRIKDASYRKLAQLAAAAKAP